MPTMMRVVCMFGECARENDAQLFRDINRVTEGVRIGGRFWPCLDVFNISVCDCRHIQNAGEEFSDAIRLNLKEKDYGCGFLQLCIRTADDDDGFRLIDVWKPTPRPGSRAT